MYASDNNATEQYSYYFHKPNQRSKYEHSRFYYQQNRKTNDYKNASICYNTRARALVHTHTRLTALFPRLPGRYQKGKTNLDFTEARDSGWHQLGHMQVCISLQTDNHASTSPLSFFKGRMPFLPPNQQRQSTGGTLSLSSN